MLHPSEIYTDGTNTTLVGDINLLVYVCDEYGVSLRYKFNSPITVKYEQPLMKFDENASILSMIPYIVLGTMITIVTLLLAQGRNIRHLGRLLQAKSREGQNSLTQKYGMTRSMRACLKGEITMMAMLAKT